MKKYFSFLGMLVSLSTFAQQPSRDTFDPNVTRIWDLVPKKITPGTSPGEASSDAMVLFDGKDLSKWTSLSGGDAKWDVKDGVMTVAKGAGNIKTKQTFGDMQLHIEWRSPAEVVGDGQNRGISGIFLQES